MSTQVQYKSVSIFRKQNPHTRVFYQWDEALRQSVGNITQIRVRNGDETCPTNPSNKILFEILDAEKISEVLSSIQINEKISKSNSLCSSELSIEFIRGEKLITMINVLQSGNSLRWKNWPADAILTQNSARYLKNLIKNKLLASSLNSDGDSKTSAKVIKELNPLNGKSEEKKLQEREVRADKSYFYMSPLDSAKSNAYLLAGQYLQCSAAKIDKYIHCLFTNEKGKTTQGYLLESSL